MHAQKEGELINEILLPRYTTIRPLGPRSDPPPTRALCPLRPPARLLQTSGIVSPAIRGPEARQRPGTSYAHEGHRSGDLGIPSRAKRSIGWTQLWGGGTHSPRLSARRHTTTAASPNVRALCSKAPTPPSMEFGTIRARAANTAAEFRGSVLWHPVPRPSDRVPPRVWCTVNA